MNPFDLAKLSEEKGQLEEQMGAEGFWDDVENANKVNQRMKVVSAKLEKYDKLVRRADDLETLIEMADEENDESLLEEIAAEYAGLTEAVEAGRMTGRTQCFRSTRAQAARRRRTGSRCFTACIPAIVKSMASP